MQQFGEKRKPLGISIVYLTSSGARADAVYRSESRAGAEFLIRTVSEPLDWDGVEELARCVVFDYEKADEGNIKEKLTTLRGAYSGLFLGEIKNVSHAERFNSGSCIMLDEVFDAFYVHTDSHVFSSLFEKTFSDLMIRRSLLGIDFCDIREFLEGAGEIKLLSSSCVGPNRVNEVFNFLANELNNINEVRRLFITTEAQAFNPDELPLTLKSIGPIEGSAVMACYVDGTLASDELQLTCYYSVNEKAHPADDEFSELLSTVKPTSLPIFKSSKS